MHWLSWFMLAGALCLVLYYLLYMRNKKQNSIDRDFE